MPTVMPKRKPKQPEPASPEKKPTSYRPAADVAAAMEEFREQHGEYPPSYSQIIDRALRMYLRSKGHKLAELPED